MDDLLTVKEAAQKLGVSARTIYRLISDGKLHTHRIAGRGRHKIPIKNIADVWEVYVADITTLNEI